MKGREWFKGPLADFGKQILGSSQTELGKYRVTPNRVLRSKCISRLVGLEPHPESLCQASKEYFEMIGILGRTKCGCVASALSQSGEPSKFVWLWVRWSSQTSTAGKLLTMPHPQLTIVYLSRVLLPFIYVYMMNWHNSSMTGFTS